MMILIGQKNFKCKIQLFNIVEKTVFSSFDPLDPPQTPQNFISNYVFGYYLSEKADFDRGSSFP